ncbi:MAG: ABC transporter permease [Gracilibacter sp. BRH_c7a]|nr:MAG: ABC transporter permease [Gracilibacter sp. BRH_c7a]
MITKPDLNLRSSFKVFNRNLKVFRKTWKSNLMFNFLEPVLYLWAMGFGLGIYINEINGLSYLEYLAPALIASSAMFATTYEMTYSSFTRMGYQKVFHGIAVTPVSMDDIVLGEIIYGTFKGVVYGLVFFLVVVIFGVVESPLALLMIIPLSLMALIFSNLSLIWTSIAPNYDSFGYFFTLFISPMFLFAGVFFPIENLPEGIHFLALLTPLYHTVAIIRPLVLGQLSWDFISHLIWLTAIALVTLRIPLIMVKNKLIK